MDDKTIRGEFEYKEKIYPFVIENRVLTVVQAACHYQQDFQEEYLGTLIGVTDTNKYIFLLDCHILSFPFLSLNTKIQMGLHGYILQNSREDYFDRISFSSPALLAFYSPKKAWKPELTDDDNMNGLTLTPFEDAVTTVPMDIAGEYLCCALYFAWKFNLRLEDFHTLNIKTVLALELPDKKHFADLGKYYLYVRDFLAFVNFKQDIPFDEINLWEKDANGKFHERGTAVIFQAKNIDYKPDAYHSITYDDLGETAFAALFKEIAEQRILKIYNPYFLPINQSEANIVDNARWLMAAISFEGEFNKRYKGIKAKRDQLFHIAKGQLLSTIDKAVQQSGQAINNPKNKYFKSFRHLINSYDTTIKEKFQFCEEQFSAEIAKSKEKYCREAGVSIETDFVQKYSDTRNRSAHGIIEPVTSEDVVTFRMLRCFIYLLTMERSSVPTEKRKTIIERLF